VVYNLPYGHGQRFGTSAPLLLNEVLGGWQINSIVTLDGGTPFDINTSGFGNIDNRADVFSYKRVSRALAGPGSNNRTYFTGTFGIPTEATSSGGSTYYTRAGNVDRNQFFGPGYKTVDFGLFKDFAITERVKFQLRAQAYNLFNTPQFTNPDGDIHNGVLSNGVYTTGINSGGTAASFGTLSATRAQSEREMEFAARINF
jgi:hypothetical protein